MDSKNSKNEATINDVYEAVVFVRDNAVTKSEFNGLVGKVDILTDRVDALTGRVDRIDALMVTKDYLDDKLADLGVEIGARINRLMERERIFKQEIISVLRRHSLADQQEIEKLEALV